MRSATIAILVAYAHAYDQSLADCQAFAGLWDNTSSSASSDILNDSNVTTLTCGGDSTWCVGKDQIADATSASCSHDYFTSVTCFTSSGGETKIRVQSNNMPNVCWQTNTDNPNVADYLALDWTITWNADMTGIVNYDSTSFATADDFDTILCDIQRTDDSNFDSSITLQEHPDSTSAVTWSGVGLMNVALFNGLALGNQDAVLLEAETMDQCLTHAAPNSNAQHAHSISPCACPGCGSTTSKPGACNDSGIDCLESSFMYEGWTTSSTYGGVYGIAKDGHVIYGPYNADGELWACEDVDNCNGFFLAEDGDYGYASTTFFPYMVGCWGPAVTDHSYQPTCTTNGCSSAGGIVGASLSAVAIAILTITSLI